MAPLIPIVTMILPALINAAERLFPKRDEGDKRGPEKKEFVLDVILSIYNAAKEHGHIPPFVAANEKMILAAVSMLVDVAAKAVKKGQAPKVA